MRRALLALLSVAIVATACGGEATPASGVTGAPGVGIAAVVEVHRSASCDCCGRYETYLEGMGVQVRSVVTDETVALKDSLGIPEDMWSCHTSLVDGYFVEGHVPVEAIQTLLETGPDIEGIALPGMPPGSPGMGGQKQSPWVVYAIADGGITEFARF